ncbi:MAG: hypothetical protein LKE96_11755 [Acetobacter peroxydans]|nr:hypothetical protein [Acetobacter peroxydans]
MEVGQELTLAEMADGIELVKRNLKLERQMEMARETLREQADVLQELAQRLCRICLSFWSLMRCCSCMIRL